VRRASPLVSRPVALAATLILLLTTGCSQVTGSESPDDITIAASLELQGSGTDLGVAYQRALQLKVDQLNASGSLDGRQIRLEIRDNRSDAAAATAQIAEFGDDPRISAIVTGFCSECLLAAVKTITDKKLPTVALAPASQVNNPVADRRYIFKLAPDVSNNAVALLAELSRLGVKTVGLLGGTDTYGRNGREVMTAEAKRFNIQVVADSSFATGESDLAAPTRAVATAKPEAVVIWALPGQANLASGGLKAAGYNGRVYYDGNAAGQLFLTGAANAADGANLVFTQTLAMDDVVATTPAKAARKQWFQDYTARYGTYQAPASFAADAVQIIVDAVQVAGSPTDRVAIRAALERTQTDGLSGLIRLTPDNHSGLTPQALVMLVARGGRWRLVG